MPNLKNISTKLLALYRSERRLDWIRSEVHWRYFTYRQRKQAQLNAIYDHKHGIETATEAPLTAMGVTPSDAERGNGVYRALPEAVFRASVASVRVDPSDFTFVDIGSGKGKVLFMAAELPFKRIVGVEYADGLHAIAARNIAAYRSPTQKCRAIEAVHGDALTYELPEGGLLLFTFNALAKDTMRQLVLRLDAKADRDPARPLYFVYTNVRSVTEIGDVFDGLGHLKVIHRARTFLVLANGAGASSTL